MIKNIIFDLGNVLVNVDYTNFKNRLRADGVTDEQYNDFFGANNGFRKYFELGYESGRISTGKFIDKCLTGLRLKMTGEEYGNVFNDMFSEIKPMSDFVRELASEGEFNLFLLSNTSPLHFDYIKEKYDYINLLHKFGLSYELKSIKPQEAIYKKAVELFNVNPHESVFIDDLKENCRIAEKFGIKTIQYTDYNIFLEKFKQLTAF
jgi:FMN phosphatase YigB (HAD superfamily)